MSIIAWIVLGIVAGIVSNQLAGKAALGLVSEALLGIVGATVAGLAFTMLAGKDEGGMSVWGLFVPLVGAGVALAIPRVIGRKAPVPVRTRPARRVRR